MIFFLNSTDRIYNDEELNKITDLLFTDGVFNTKSASHEAWLTGGDFLVEANGSNMNITARAGSAAIGLTVGGKTFQVLIQEPANLAGTVSANPSLAIRSDAVVLRVDQSILDGDDLNAAGSNAVSLAVIAGNSATVLTDAEISIALGGDPFIRLADIAVPQSATAITTQMLDDVRSLVKMSNSVHFASDSFQFNALSNDPERLEAGMVWYNTSEGILKFFDGVNVTALQTQDFNWGYYPPNGLDQNAEDFESIIENDSVSGLSSAEARKTIDALGGGNTTIMCGQLFKMPNIANPYLRVKMANPSYQAGIEFTIYTVNGSNDPNTLVETLATFTPVETPSNEYVSFYLDGSLYTPGVNYILVGRANSSGFINAGDSDYKTAAIATSAYEDDEYFLGIKSGSAASIQTLPTSLTWGGLTADQQFVMNFGEREEVAIGENDASTKNYLVSQAFIPKSQDITYFSVTKGANRGTPTGDITAYLYNADANNNPTGDVLTSAVITAAEWATGSSGEEKLFAIAYDELVIGSKYVIVLDTDVHSNTDNYVIFFGNTTSGTAKRNTTADGWATLSGNFFFGIYTSSIRKIVVTDNNGFVPKSLIPRTDKSVTYLTSSATPSFNVETTDAVCITALATNITDMSANLVGTPADFQELTFRITASGGVRTVAWGTKFAASGVALDTSIAAGKTLTAKFIYDAILAKFSLVISTETP